MLVPSLSIENKHLQSQFHNFNWKSQMSLIAVHENGIKLKDIKEGNYYRLFYDDGSINFKLNTEGLPIEDDINDMTSHEIDMIRWARDIIKAEESKVIL